jgi:hypothetical protein
MLADDSKKCKLCTGKKVEYAHAIYATINIYRPLQSVEHVFPVNWLSP